MKLLKKLYQIHSPSGREGKLIRFICNWVKYNVPDARIALDQTTGNLYITKGGADSYAVLCAHLDQVQRKYPRDYTVCQTEHIIFAYSPKTRAYCGLGADDKNGVWIALKCLKKFPALKVCLFTSEEVGCVGSSHADMGFFKDAKYVIQADRRGAHDLVTNIGFTELCSDEFLADIPYQKYGYAITDGLSTDVGQLKENGLEVSCINLSTGYYEPHSDREYTVISDLLNCKAFVEEIISTCHKVYPHSPTYAMLGYDADQDWVVYEMLWNELTLDPHIPAEYLYDNYKHIYPFMTFHDVESVLEDFKNYNDEKETDKTAEDNILS